MIQLKEMRKILLSLVVVSLCMSNIEAQKGKNILGFKLAYGVNDFALGGEQQIRRDLTVYPLRGFVQSARIDPGKRYTFGFLYGRQVFDWLRVESGASFNTINYKFRGVFNVMEPRFSPGGDMEMPLSPVLIEGKSSYHHLEFDLALRVYPWKGRWRMFFSPFLTASYYLSDNRKQTIFFENASIKQQSTGENTSVFPVLWLMYSGAGFGLQVQLNSKIELALIGEIGMTLNHYRRDQIFTSSTIASGGGTLKMGYKL